MQTKMQKIKRCFKTTYLAHVSDARCIWPRITLCFIFLVDDFAACDVVDCVCCGLGSARMLCPEVTLVPLRSPSCLL